MRKHLIKTMVVMALIATACNTDPEAGPASESTESAASAAISVDEAISTANAYFTAFNSRDVDAVKAWFPSNATFSDNFTGSIPREAWEQRLVWNLAQGTTLDNPGCVAADSESTSSRSVTCQSATLNAQTQAVGHTLFRPLSVYWSHATG